MENGEIRKYFGKSFDTEIILIEIWNFSLVVACQPKSPKLFIFLQNVKGSFK